MGILDSASGNSVYRGYEYCKNGNVISYAELSDFEYKGEVQGTNKFPYHVVINLQHPKNSSCDCPFANGHTICKHMVALFFVVSPDDFEDYESWYENNYEEEYDDYEDEYDEDCYYSDNYNRYRSKFVKPLFFNEILSSFVNGLSKEQLKDIVIDELNRDEEYAFYTYLKEEFDKYSLDKKSVRSVLDNIYARFYKLSYDYDYNYKDYSVVLLSRNEKEMICNAYIDKNLKVNIDKIILNPEIAVYDDYKWIVSLYKQNNSKRDVEAYAEKLELFFNTLKHYSIKNSVPKSNVLVSIYCLRDYSLEETVQMIIKNCKYEEFIDYVLESIEDCERLYKIFDEFVENAQYLNKEYIPKIYYKFYLRLVDKEICNQYNYYSFLFNRDVCNLFDLKNTDKFDYYVNKIIANTKDIVVLERLYVFLNNKSELFKLLFNRKNEHRLIDNIDILRDDYNDKLAKYFKDRFYEVVKVEKSRENYKRATTYVSAMFKLNGGEKLVSDLVSELRNSEYARRSALFDEIEHAINK